ncbi:hypothetical protein EW145_g5915 [Phellinidium pouzarii]|uniref:Citrate transporter-like domain-containing protein n=1 Tax=Phellinidium pouzarii TaxID=167371 RepID=A0A4S4KYF5_9AGAM|nr:hypothetical protein EW145_g5915 [Phellinidium pouzarii]
MISSWQSILALVVFLLTNIVGVFPSSVKVPLPASVSSITARIAVYIRVCFPSQTCCSLHPTYCKTSRKPDQLFHWHRVPLNFQTAPPIAVLLLLATRVLSGSDVRQGIVGTNGVKPISIMALFLSLAYLSISLDTTGLFRFLAFWVARKGVCVGNDPVILFGTPFLSYFAHVTGIIPPTAWIFAQFSVANIASAVLPPSNLTNLVLTGAFSISFISYPAYTVLPALAAAAAVCPLLIFGLFSSRQLIPREINAIALQDAISDSQTTNDTSSPSTSLEAPTGNSDSARSARHAPSALNDKKGAIFGTILLTATLAVLVGTSPLGIPVWEVTVPPAVIMLLRDVWYDRQRWRKNAVTGELETQEQGDKASPTSVELVVLPTHAASISVSGNLAIGSEKRHLTMLSVVNNCMQNYVPTLSSIVPRLPFSLVLFAFCMFILVQALTTRGWVEIFATWWSAWIRVCSAAGIGSAIVGSVCLMLLISTLLCNLCGTNIGTTILLTRVLQVWLETSPVTIPNEVRLGSIYALALGTNFGAFTFSFSASLAGLLWRDILHQKGIYVHQKQFAILNSPIIGIATVTAAAVLVAEMYVVKHLDAGK